jgi:hypothetical protein
LAISLEWNFLGYASRVEVPNEYLGALGFFDSLVYPNPE